MEELEEAIFSKCSLKEEDLLSYGFILVNGTYTYKTSLPIDGFDALIEIQGDEVRGKVIENDLNEEYSLFRSFNATGFAYKVGAAYKALLEDIRDKCFMKTDYLSLQSVRIVNQIKEIYNVDAEEIFDDPSIKVFRHEGTKKWFGLIMRVNGKKLGRKMDSPVEIINVKIDPDELYRLMGIKGAYLAYHMSKKHWVTFSLDDSLPDKVILDYIDRSFTLTKGKAKK